MGYKRAKVFASMGYQGLQVAHLSPLWPKTEGPAHWRALEFTGAGEKSRTPDLRITNALLYQLSYAGVAAAAMPPREGRILAEPLHCSANGARRGATGTFFSVA